MAKIKFDGVVHAVHYNPDGQVAWVRAFLKRGATFSDRILIERKTLIEQLKSGKRFYTGQRVPQLASTFEIADRIVLLEKEGKQILMTGNREVESDHLEGVPVI